ncbi:T9SS type A sorting domain-containing protein, partial [Aquimarina litoralis]|uniref:T9SS type A sorting domain-containing protein n=1 Tax=Aquimarina litoralis TaxID=584605 RepID=UPI001C55A4A5
LWDASSSHQNLQWIITPISETKAPDPSENKTIIAYPNPIADKFTIEDVENSIIRIYDINGKIVFTTYISNAQEIIDISSFAQGIYYLKIIDKQENLILKLIKL